MFCIILKAAPSYSFNYYVFIQILLPSFPFSFPPTYLVPSGHYSRATESVNCGANSFFVLTVDFLTYESYKNVLFSVNI